MIDKSELSTTLKAWMFQHDLIVRLIWQRMLYALPTSTVVKLEQLISKLLRRWQGPVTQGIPQDWTLHSTNSQMPVSLLVGLYKVAKERLLLTL